MFLFKTKEQNKRLRARVSELEEIICPFGEHDFIIIDNSVKVDIIYSQDESYTERKLKCTKCNKTVYDSDIIGFKYKAKKSEALL